MWRNAFQKWDGRGVFLLRLDYGYCVGDAGEPDLDPGSVDLERLPLARIEELLHGPPGRAGVRVLKGADRLSSLGRRRGGDGVWGALGHAAESDGVLLVARFPRVSQSLDRALRERGVWAGFAENAASGGLPPLYARFSPQEELFCLHLAYEWETGLARARATTVLADAGALMALRGIITPAHLALGLGATAGAARSYLNWMTDAGLARRAGTGFALRHPALGALFEEAIRPQGGRPMAPLPVPEALASTPAPLSEPAPPPGPRWDPSELD